LGLLHLHRSSRADRLVEALGDGLALPLDDPVQPEVVCVPTRGVERWIAQRLSHRLGTGDHAGSGGVCANVEFPFPGALVGRAVAAASGVDPDGDPWAPERAVWPMLAIIDGSASDPALAPLHRHLAACAPPGTVRRFGFARHLSDLFDRYGIHRPDLICGWAESAPAPGEGEWQHHLWRELRAAIGLPAPAERLPAALRRIEEGEVALDLPERLAVFGLTRLPQVHLRVLMALSRRREVHLFLLHPSGVLWDRLEAELASAIPAGRVARRAEDPTRLVAHHPLLRSWAPDAREMQLVLSAHGVGGGRHYDVTATAGPPRLLGELQAGIRHDRPPGPARLTLDPADDSLRIHACHGPSRQVEVVRDAVWHLLADDPTLEPRDVIVMCPDIEAYAPLIQAVFGEPRSGAGPGGAVRVRLADRSLLQTNPLLAVSGRLLELAAGRVTATDLLDLAGRPAVARRFRFSADDLGQIRRWVAGTAIHWGLDAEHRRAFGLAGVADGTWALGLDRLALAVAVPGSSETVVGGVTPYPDLPSSQVDLAGRLLELVARVAQAVGSFAGRRTVAEWMESLQGATESLAEADPGQAWQLEQLRTTLSEAAGEAGPARAELDLAEVTGLLAGRLAGRPTRANFRTGDLTFCTLVPMRSVPHRVVAVLGLDEGAFPRHPERDGDDLLLVEPFVGEREARSEDRQLLLDALLAATEHLILTYSGSDLRTNRPRPPSTPLAELIDLVDRLAVAADGAPASATVVVRQPLHAHDPANFTPGGLSRPGPWSFDPVQRTAAEASLSPRPRRPWLVDPLPAAEETDLSVEELVRFVRHPVREFLRQRLSLALASWEDNLADRIPSALDGRMKWAVRDRLLAAVGRGIPLEHAWEAEVGRGHLPPTGLTPSEGLLSPVRELASRAAAYGWGTEPARDHPVRVDLGSGRALTGSVPTLDGCRIVACAASRLASGHRLEAWVRFLALTAARPDRDVLAVTVGRAPTGDGVAVAVLGPVTGDADVRRRWALERLDRLVAMRDAGLRQPLRLFPRTSCAWAQRRHNGSNEEGRLRAATDEWEDRGESKEPEHALVWPSAVHMREFLRAEPPDGDGTLPWPPGATSRFEALARLLWDPILDHERSEKT
jgi:exodeoxyribonuclease V gamma subunit